MKFFNIRLFALMAFLFVGSNMSAYIWGFSNYTKKSIDIRFGLMGAAGWWNNTLQPFRKVEFAFPGGSWWAGYCMWGFDWKITGQNDNSWKRGEVIYLPNELYQETVKQAANLGSGFDNFLCTAFAIIRTVNKGQCPSMFSALIDWIGGVVAQSACRSRDFTVIEDGKGQLYFVSILN